MHFKEPCAIISHCLNLKSPRLLTLFSNDTAESQLNTKLTQTEKFIIFGCFCSLYLPHHFSSCQVKHNCNIFFATLLMQLLWLYSRFQQLQKRWLKKNLFEAGTIFNLFWADWVGVLNCIQPTRVLVET